MDCVGCDKCRLWGKLQTSGYGTALKVLFEFDPKKSEDFRLRRTEVVSLIITLQRLSHSIWAVEQFKTLINAPAPTTMKRRLLSYLPPMEVKSFGDAFDEELREVANAVRFVLMSYVKLPVNLWRTWMLFVSRLWDRYILGESMGKGRLNLDDILRR